MIESRYWKEELHRIAAQLHPRPRPKRWSERQHCIIERDLVIGFFIVRRLIELHKVSPAIRNFRMDTYFAPTRGTLVTRLNSGNVFALYDVGRERKTTTTPLSLSNQFVHAIASFVTRDERRNWDSVFVVSDFDRNNGIWRVPVAGIRSLFEMASRDYPRAVSFKWNQRTNDYDMSSE